LSKKTVAGLFQETSIGPPAALFNSHARTKAIIGNSGHPNKASISHDGFFSLATFDDPDTFASLHLRSCPRVHPLRALLENRPERLADHIVVI